MFDVRPITILNSLSRVHSVAANADPAFPAGDTGIAVDRSNKFGVSEVKSIYKKAAVAAVKEVYEIILPDTLNAGLYRLNLNLQLAGESNNADYARFLTYKGRPLTTEFNLTSNLTVSTGIAPYIAMMNKVFKREEIIDVTVSLTSRTINSTLRQILVITAGNEYVRFKTGTNIELYNTTTGVFDEFATGSVYTAGVVGFGTYDFMVRNVSLPTMTKLNFYAVNQDELPVKGFTYTQYSINYTKKYPVPVGMVVGVMPEANATQVYWVRNDLVTAFDAILTTSLPAKTTTV